MLRKMSGKVIPGDKNEWDEGYDATSKDKQKVHKSGGGPGELLRTGTKRQNTKGTLIRGTTAPNVLRAAGDEDTSGDDGKVGIFYAWGILHPYSSKRLAWDMFVVVLLIYTVLFVPFALAFSSTVCGEQTEPFADFLMWFVDSCFWLDILLNFTTAIVDPDAENSESMVLISDWRVIAWSYLRGWFWLDALGSLPIHVIEKSFDDGSCSLAALKTLRLNRLARMIRLVKLLRLARLARWSRLVTKVKDGLSINPGHLRLMQFVAFVCVLAHLLSCMLYGMVDWEYAYSTTWASETTVVVPGMGSMVLACPAQLFDEDGSLASDNPTIYEEEEVDGRKKNVTSCLDGNDQVPKTIKHKPGTLPPKPHTLNPEPFPRNPQHSWILSHNQ